METRRRKPRKHPDILTADEAIRYLRIDSATPDMQSAMRVLERMRAQGKVRAIKWCAKFLYHRADLDRFVAETLDALNAPENAPEGGRYAPEGGEE